MEGGTLENELLRGEATWTAAEAGFRLVNCGEVKV